MSQGTTFTGRVYLGTNQTTSLSLRAVAGVPSFVLGDNAGDQVLSDNGRIYVCDGAAWSPLINADGGTTMTSALVVGLPSPGPALSASATGSTISTSTATDAYSVTDTAGGGVVARIDTGSGAARITAENTGATKIPLNLEIDALQINGTAGSSGQVLLSNGAGAAPTWTTLAPAGTGAGGGILYYLNENTAATPPTVNIPVPATTVVKELGLTADVPQTTVTSNTLSQVTYDLVANFVTTPSVPNVTSIPAGIWAFNIFASSNANIAAQTILQVEVGKYDGVNAPTIIATSNDVSIYDPTVPAVYTVSVVIPASTTLLATDRIYVAIRARATQANRQVTLYFGDGTPTNVVTTLPSAAGGDLSGTYPNPAVVGMGGTSTKTLFVIEGGQYATLQAAVDAASTGTMILVGPKTTGDWGDVSMTTVNRNLIIAAMSGAGSNKVVKVGSITFNPTGALDPNLNEVYLYGLYIQGTFAGSSALSLAGTGTARLRAWGCYILNDSVTGTAAVTNSNAAANSSLYIDNCVVSLSNSATGSTVVHSGGYTVIRNRCEISASTAGGATGFALNASAGTVEITDSNLSNSRNVAVANVSGATTFVSAAYSTLYNSSNLAGACCVNIATAGATFGCGDATLSAGTIVATAAVPLVSVANGVFVYTVVNFGFATSFAAASTTAALRPSSQSVGRKILADVGTIGTIAASPATVANLRTAHRFDSSVAALALPAMTLADDGLRIEIINTFAGTVTVTPSAGVARQMTTGGGQAWVWRGTTSTWYCTSNV